MAPETAVKAPLQQRALALAKRHWDWAVVAVLAVYMLVVRLKPADDFNSERGVFFIGTDPYYHARHVTYSVENFPRTLQYDPMTQYPIGTDPGQFGTLFDQLGAALAWLAGLFVDGGEPSQETLLDVFVAYPAILGALAVVPIYLFARAWLGRAGGLVAAVVAALLPGEWLVRSLAAYVDHHVLEAVLSTLAVWATLVAVRAWERSGVTVTEVQREPKALWDPARGRHALFVSFGAVIAFWLYLAAWPSGVLFIGIVGVWILLDTLFERARGLDPSPVVLTGVVVFLPLFFLLLFQDRCDRCADFSALNYTWMQPVSALLVALASAALGALALVWDRRTLPRWAYPAAAVGVVLVGLLVVRLALPQLWGNTLSGFSWITGIGVADTRLTIAEAQPPGIDRMYNEFGLLFYTAMAGFAGVLVSALRGMRRADTLVVVWAVLATSAAFTQARFLYYLAVIVALLNAELYTKLVAGYRALARAMSSTKGKKGARAKSEGSDQQLAMNAHAFAAVVLVLALLPVNVLGTEGCQGANAWTLADCFAPGEEVLWHRPLVWMKDNTPPVGLSLSEQYDEPPRGQRFDYPEGAYGVLSWWDYGHQIEFEAERPPVANPFQQQAPLASQIFTAPSEGEALALLDDYLGPENTVRYVVIDDAMASTKFTAITIWAGVDDVYSSGGRKRIELPEGGSLELPVIGPRVERMFLIDLYYSDGNGLDHFRLVQESPIFTATGNRGRVTEEGFRFHNYNTILTRASAPDFLDQFGTLNYHSGPRALPAGERIVYDVRTASSVKVYERVEGAVINGEAPPGSEVVVEVPLSVAASGRTFIFERTVTADDEGRFEARVPYSTTEPVPISRGGTNTGVVATGPYAVRTDEGITTVHVPDRAVLEGGEVRVGTG